LRGSNRRTPQNFSDNSWIVSRSTQRLSNRCYNAAGSFDLYFGTSILARMPRGAACSRIFDIMKKLVVVMVCTLFQICANAQSPSRPRITGIDHVAFYTTAPDGVKKLYGEVLGLSSADPVEPGGTLRYLIGTQWVGYSPAPAPKSTDRMDHVALRTDNIAAMRKYLIAKGIKVPKIQGRGDHSLFFVLDDPDGHKIEFVERGKSEAAPSDSGVSHHMIHAGFLVYHQEA